MNKPVRPSFRTLCGLLLGLSVVLGACDNVPEDTQPKLYNFFRANGSTFNIIKNTPTVIDILRNDSVYSSISVSVSDPRNGTLVQNRGHKTFTYSPHTDFVGKDSIIYSLSDGRSVSTSKAIFYIVDTAQCQPEARIDQFVVVENSSVTTPALTTNDRICGDETITLTQGPTRGTANLIGNDVEARIYYRPNPNYWGTDLVAYQLRTRTGKNSTSQARFQILPDPACQSLFQANPDTIRPPFRVLPGQQFNIPYDSLLVNDRYCPNDLDPIDRIQLTGISTNVNTSTNTGNFVTIQRTGSGDFGSFQYRIESRRFSGPGGSLNQTTRVVIDFR